MEHMFGSFRKFLTHFRDKSDRVWLLPHSISLSIIIVGKTTIYLTFIVLRCITRPIFLFEILMFINLAPSSSPGPKFYRQKKSPQIPWSHVSSFSKILSHFWDRKGVGRTFGGTSIFLNQLTRVLLLFINLLQKFGASCKSKDCIRIICSKK